MSASTWRHVEFIERPVPLSGQTNGNFSWLMLSDVCKHCEVAGCLEHCPTGSIVRTEFGGVYVQPDICNGCGYCVATCPFGVLRLEGDTLVIGEGCTMCGACVEVCEVQALALEKLPPLNWPPFPVNEIILFKSTLTPKGSIYTPLQVIPLGKKV